LLTSQQYDKRSETNETGDIYTLPGFYHRDTSHTAVFYHIGLYGAFAIRRFADRKTAHKNFAVWASGIGICI